MRSALVLSVLTLLTRCSLPVRPSEVNSTAPLSRNASQAMVMNDVSTFFLSQDPVLNQVNLQLNLTNPPLLDMTVQIGKVSSSHPDQEYSLHFLGNDSKIT